MSLKRKIVKMVVTRRRKPFSSSTGGKAIASGGFGCVFDPAIKCKGSRNSTSNNSRNSSSRSSNSEVSGKGLKNNTITKLMKIKYAKAEYKEIKKIKELLQDIPNYSNYFLLDGFSLCAPGKLSKEDLQRFDRKCKSLKKIDITSDNVNSSLDQLLSLNMPYGGIDIGDYIEQNRMNYKKIHRMNASLIQLLRDGIVPMNEKSVYHCDIKDSNVLVQEETTELVRTRLIDWGLSTSFTSNSSSGNTIPKMLTNRPFQFNVPFSVVLFNDTFTKMYADFLKTHKDPTFFIIRSFVINYVISWVNKRGPGHLKALNNMFVKMFQRGLINIEDSFKDDLIEFDYTFYFIFEYISYVLFKFTRNGSFQKMEYFTQIFLKNNDIWGFVMVYLPILEYLNSYYKQLCDCEKEIIDTIRGMILYVIECSYVPIDVDKIIEMLEKLQTLFLQAGKKSKTRFLEKTPSSNSNFNPNSNSNNSATKTKKHSKHISQRTKTLRPTE
jgi:hypothetical protein